MTERLSQAMHRALVDIKARSKGWPVGIPINRRTAHALHKRGLVDWAPPLYAYPKRVYAVRLTATGVAAVQAGMGR